MKKSWMKKIAFTAGALALSLGVVGLKANAAETPITTETNDVFVTKTLITPKIDVVEVPNMTFQFITEDGKYYPFTAEGGKSDTEGSVAVPAIPGQSISFSEADLAEPTPADGTATSTKNSANLLEDVKYTQVGVYEYTVRENQAVTGTIPSGGAVAYDKTTYKLSVWVTNGENGEFVITPMLTKLTDENGTAVVDGKYDTGADGFAFTNKYTFEDPTTIDPEKPEDADFWVKKLVAGSQADVNKNFNYTISIPVNELTKDKIYTLKFANPEATEQTTIIPGVDQTFTLKHNQYAYIEDITAGAQVTVAETDDADYDEANKAIFNGNEKLTTDADYEPLKATGTLGSAANNVTYTNTHKGAEVTPTGILMNNLPYVALIVIGGLGLGFYVMNKRRNA